MFVLYKTDYTAACVVKASENQKLLSHKLVGWLPVALISATTSAAVTSQRIYRSPWLVDARLVPDGQLHSCIWFNYQGILGPTSLTAYWMDCNVMQCISVDGSLHECMSAQIESWRQQFHHENFSAVKHSIMVLYNFPGVNRIIIKSSRNCGTRFRLVPGIVRYQRLRQKDVLFHGLMSTISS